MMRINNKGFIATSVLYGIASIFIVSVAIILNNYLSTRKTSNTLTDVIKEELRLKDIGCEVGYSWIYELKEEEELKEIKTGCSGVYKLEVYGEKGKDAIFKTTDKNGVVTDNVHAGSNGSYSYGYIRLKEFETLTMNKLAGGKGYLSKYDLLDGSSGAGGDGLEIKYNDTSLIVSGGGSGGNTLGACFIEDCGPRNNSHYANYAKSIASNIPENAVSNPENKVGEDGNKGTFYTDSKHRYYYFAGGAGGGYFGGKVISNDTNYLGTDFGSFAGKSFIDSTRMFSDKNLTSTNFDSNINYGSSVEENTKLILTLVSK